MSINSINQVNNIQNTKQNAPSPAAVGGGIMAGLLTNSLVQSGIPAISTATVILPNMQKLNSGLTSADTDVLAKAADLMIKQNLKGNEAEIVKMESQNLDEVKNILKNDIKSKSFGKFLPDTLAESGAIKAMKQVEVGNSFYASSSNKIIAQSGPTQLTVFHELGHSMNANGKNYIKALTKIRGAGLLALPIALIALIKGKKAEGEKPKDTLDTATDFVKDNAGVLSTAAFSPMIAEEWLASHNANKFVKQNLPPELAKKVCKSNKLGLLSYVLVAAAAGIGITLGVKVKDRITEPKTDVVA